MNPLFCLLIVPVTTALVSYLIGLCEQRISRIVAVVGAALFLCFSLSTVVLTLRQGPLALYWRNHLLLVSDTLSAPFLLILGVVGFFTTLYSAKYVEEDAGRYFLWFLSFLASMSLLIVCDDLLLLVAAWELIGLCSYALIFFKWSKPQASAAATKALLLTELGSATLLVGFVYAIASTGTRSLHTLLESNLPSIVVGILAFTVLFAAFTKSAQFPFHTWLPDAMIAPTPVSALLHAATLVKAGVYLALRFHPVLTSFLWARTLLALVGAFTALSASILMLRETDLKRVLAYSTITHLAIIYTVLSTNSPIAIPAALFHVLAHGFFKAALFLGAGLVEQMAGTRDLTALGGLSVHAPITSFCFLIAALGAAGVPLTSGFVGKWLLFTGLLTAGDPSMVVILLVLPASTLSAIAILRAYGAVFAGEPSFEKPFSEPSLLIVPQAGLAALTLLLGLAPSLVYPLLNPPEEFLPSFGGFSFKIVGMRWAAAVSLLLIILILVISLTLLLVMPQRRVPLFLGGQHIDGRVTSSPLYLTTIGKSASSYVATVTNTDRVWRGLLRLLVQPTVAFGAFVFSAAIIAVSVPLLLTYPFLGLLVVTIATICAGVYATLNPSPKKLALSATLLLIPPLILSNNITVSTLTLLLLLVGIFVLGWLANQPSTSAKLWIAVSLLVFLSTFPPSPLLFCFEPIMIRYSDLRLLVGMAFARFSVLAAFAEYARQIAYRALPTRALRAALPAILLAVVFSIPYLVIAL